MFRALFQFLTNDNENKAKQVDGGGVSTRFQSISFMANHSDADILFDCYIRGTAKSSPSQKCSTRKKTHKKPSPTSDETSQGRVDTGVSSAEKGGNGVSGIHQQNDDMYHGEEFITYIRTAHENLLPTVAIDLVSFSNIIHLFSKQVSMPFLKNIVTSPESKSRMNLMKVSVPETGFRFSSHDYLRISVPETWHTPIARQDKGTRKQISAGIFYGSPAGKPSKQSPQLWRLLHNIQKDLTEEKEKFQRGAVWATFPRQDQAMQFASNHERVNVFCYQDHVTWQRRFLATTYEELWRRYKQMDAKYRHHYEVIQEGHPCHLYFDLEFNQTINADANGSAMVDLLLAVVSDAMLDIYGIQFELDWTVELDSSTTEKFSRHLIVHVPNVAFKDNSHVGAFVGEEYNGSNVSWAFVTGSYKICARVAKLQEMDTKYRQLYTVKGESHAALHNEIFLDSAVYSRNRCFRLPFSTKAGKTSFLLPTDRFKCKNMNEYEVFMYSLICRKDPGVTRLLTFDPQSVESGSSINASYILSRPKSLKCSAASTSAFGKSPFPALDTFVESICSVEDIPGSIRSWYWFSDYGIMVYNVAGNRFCENIGRQHKSNHVMYIVDFRTAGYYQKCHDPDCRGYRSPLRPIPVETVPENFRVVCTEQKQFVELSSSGDVGGLSYPATSSMSLNLLSSMETSDKSWEMDDWNDEAGWDEVINTLQELEIRMESSQSATQHCEKEHVPLENVRELSSTETSNGLWEMGNWNDQSNWAEVINALEDLEMRIESSHSANQNWEKANSPVECLIQISSMETSHKSLEMDDGNDESLWDEAINTLKELETRMEASRSAMQNWEKAHVPSQILGNIENVMQRK